MTSSEKAVKRRLCKGQAGSSSAFLRDVRTAPEKSIFLASINQLNDLGRFCCEKDCWCILGADPTFNICDFNVTVTTYKHPLLVKNGTEEHPVMLGPTLIHSHKTFDSYYTLPSNLVRLKPSLAHLKAFGTDGEKNVYESLKSTFKEAKHLLCAIHMKDNILKKCADLGIASDLYIIEIFGKKVGNTKVKGLMDCDEKEFDETYEQLKSLWLRRKCGGEFVKYMDAYKKEDIK
ncbi:uncharacterized protein LOC130649165 [Hydractinia symbiolongicarpus]|uniref:uncharacterized protein LOC130649165 n=1 Tax=Hydractinia symbiolongicarpus TaxID=13093 RepID=UPI00254EE8BC|nr:uncharacterized protein LOC130649165 [Hydractinia symbiolongicarpus]